MFKFLLSVFLTVDYELHEGSEHILFTSVSLIPHVVLFTLVSLMPHMVGTQ